MNARHFSPLLRLAALFLLGLPIAHFYMLGLAWSHEAYPQAWRTAVDIFAVLIIPGAAFIFSYHAIRFIRGIQQGLCEGRNGGLKLQADDASPRPTITGVDGEQ